MSVVKSKRGEGQLLVITKANELAAYSIKICSNETNFPKRYRWCITNKIVDAESDYKLRKQYQTKALSSTTLSKNS